MLELTGSPSKDDDFDKRLPVCHLGRQNVVDTRFMTNSGEIVGISEFRFAPMNAKLRLDPLDMARPELERD